MADGAVLELRVGHVVERWGQRDARTGSSRSTAVVTFQAKREDHGAFEQPGVGRAVWQVARLAALYAHGSVFENKRAAHFFMTTETRLLIHGALRHHTRPVPHLPRRRERPMRVVAIAALHRPLVDAVLERHGELCPD